MFTSYEKQGYLSYPTTFRNLGQPKRGQTEILYTSTNSSRKCFGKIRSLSWILFGTGHFTTVRRSFHSVRPDCKNSRQESHRYRGDLFNGDKRESIARNLKFCFERRAASGRAKEKNCTFFAFKHVTALKVENCVLGGELRFFRSFFSFMLPSAGIPTRTSKFC